MKLSVNPSNDSRYIHFIQLITQGFEIIGNNISIKCFCIVIDYTWFMFYIAIKLLRQLL